MAFRSVVTLSRRESEVAELVGDGLTNREIATRLFISERTVEGHVSQICGKLGVRSRVQIATWLAADESRATGSPDAARRFRVVSRGDALPWWLLTVMAAGAPLPVVAALYPWLVRSTSQSSVLLNLFLTILALLFLVIPALAGLGFVRRRAWARVVAIGGLLSLGILVLTAGAAAVATDLASGRGFHPADFGELAYAGAIPAMLVVHLVAGGATLRRDRLARPLTAVVAIFWILRYGYGLSLGALVLSVLWSTQPNGNRGTK